MRDPAALIFDMDGVLVDSEPLHKKAKELAFAQHQIFVDEPTYDRYKGRPDETIVTEIVGSRANAADLVSDILKLKHQHFENLESSLQPVEGATEFLRWAKDRYRLALATSATPRNRAAALELLDASKLFEAIVDAGEHTNPKPDPEIFLVALQRLHLDSKDAWVIEDSVNGIKAAKSAGCFAVAMTTTFDSKTLKQAGADRIIHTFAELKQILIQPQSL